MRNHIKRFFVMTIRENETVYSNFEILTPIENNTIIYNTKIAIALSKMEDIYEEHHIINMEDPSFILIEKKFVSKISAAYNPTEKKLTISSIDPLKFFFLVRNNHKFSSYCYNPTNK